MANLYFTYDYLWENQKKKNNKKKRTYLKLVSIKRMFTRMYKMRCTRIADGLNAAKIAWSLTQLEVINIERNSREINQFMNF